jgi:hypothetical protein
MLSLVLVVAFSQAAKAQLAKEGSFSGKAAFNCAHKAIAQVEHLQLNYECLGIFMNDAGHGFLHNASIHGIGGFHAVKGVYEYDHSFTVWTDPEGDQAFLTHSAEGSLQAAEAIFKWVGGTGKYKGLTGGGAWSWISGRPAVEGTFQGYFKMKGSYKLP